MTTLNGPDFQAEDYRRTMPEFADAGTNRLPTGVVELRVHGVAGGTAEQNLSDPHPIKINGDAQAGVYRRRTSLDSGPQRTVEAYNWSSINSGKTARAFWLALFPFAAVNFAGWLLPMEMMEPRPPETNGPSTQGFVGWLKIFLSNPWKNRLVAQACVRGVALLVTAITMLGIAAITVDLIGLQCGAKGACADPWWFGWFEPIRTSSLLDGEPTRFAIVGTLVPLAALGGLWLLSKQSANYDAYGTRSAADGARDPKALAGPSGRHIDTIRLNTVDFWQAPDSAYVQGWIHTAVALATLAAMLAASLRVLAPDSPHHTTFLLIATMAIAWLGVLTFAALLMSSMRQIPRRRLRKSNKPDRQLRPTWILALVPLLLLLFAAFLGWEAAGTLETGSPVLEPIRNGLIAATLLGGVLVAVLALLVSAQRALLMIIAVGFMWYLVLASERGIVGEPPFLFKAGGAWAWVGAEAALAAIFLVIVWWRSKAQNPSWWNSAPTEVDPTHRQGLLWIVGSAGVLAGVGMGADARSGENPWLVFAAAASVVLIYLLIAFSMRASIGRTNRDLDAPEPSRMRSGPTFVMAAVALCSVLAIAASSTIWIAGALGDSVAHSGTAEVGEIQLAYAAEAGWFALAAFVGFVVLFGLLALRIGSLRWFRWRNDVAVAISKAYDDDPPPPYGEVQQQESPKARKKKPPRYAKQARTNRLWANLIDEIDWLITGGVMATLAVLGAAVVARFRGDQPGGRVDDAIGLATQALALLSVAAFLLVRSARNDRQLRGTIGIMWEVMGFFPRRFHPLAPPCYSERTVIDVRNRLIDYTKTNNHNGTILLAHSQGTMLSTAALLSLNGPRPTIPAPDRAVPSGSELDDLAFVTYGCMLQRLFGRAWPDQLQRHDLIDLKARLEFGSDGRDIRSAPQAPEEYPQPVGTPRWMNFGRYTDYLGGRVFDALQPLPTPDPMLDAPDADARPDDIMFQDPTRRWRFPGETTDARRWLHSFNYESDTEDHRFREHVWGWARTFGGKRSISSP